MFPDFLIQTTKKTFNQKILIFLSLKIKKSISPRSPIDEVKTKANNMVTKSEVIVVKNPKEIKKAPKNHLVSIKSLEMSVLIEGQKFNIK